MKTLAVVVIAALVVGVAVYASNRIKADTPELAIADGILPYFDDAVWERLQSIPVRSERTVATALAQTVRWTEEPTLWVSTEWDTFSSEFRRDLLVHEYLHILQAESGLDLGRFYQQVQEWYHNRAYGASVPSGNYIKYILSFELYGGKDKYPDSEIGEEAFAYIGTQIARGRGFELPAHILNYYDGLLAGQLLCPLTYTSGVTTTANPLTRQSQRKE